MMAKELVEGTDQSLQINVVPFTVGAPERWLEGQPAVDPAEMQRLTLQRDQPVDVVINGEKYSLLFPTAHVSADADPSTIYAQLMVAWRSRSDAAKHGATKL